MASMNKFNGNKSVNFLTKLIRGSLILSLLNRLIAYVYSLIQNSFFGYIFTGYNHQLRSHLFKNDRILKKIKTYSEEFRYGICRRIECSFTVNLVAKSMKAMLRCRLKVLGAFLVSFGIYTALISLLRNIMENTAIEILVNNDMTLSLAMIITSIPFIISRKSLGESLTSTLIGRLLIKATGYSDNDFKGSSDYIGRMNIAFGLGILCGVLSYWIAPIYILCGIIAVVLMYLILLKPEVGVLSLFITMPWFPTMLLALIVGYTALCYAIKLFRGKRVFRLEPIDVVVIAFAVLILFGGFISLSSTSLQPALLMTCLILGYFLTVQLLSTREWLIRCSVSCVLSATAVAIYGMAMYFLGLGYSSKAWLDDEMFAGIAGRAVATLGNPNVLGEYLILIIPIAAAMIFGLGEGLRRIPALFCTGILGACLILTWSRGAWLALLIAGLIFLLVWNKRSMWLIFAGLASIPFLPMILPESIIYRFTSIGNMADSSTSYRVYIWRATVNMIEDNFFTGIGIGEGSWDSVYPMYTYMGIEAAPHSHNLYLQILLELGIFGIALFALFLFLMYQSGFTFFRSLSGSSSLKKPDISSSILSQNLSSENTISSAVRQGKSQLRISVLGPLCGILAVIIQGITDYSWYNYRLFLMFWLVCGLALAYVRCGRNLLSDGNTNISSTDESSCSSDIHVISDSDKNNKKQKMRKRKGESYE